MSCESQRITIALVGVGGGSEANGVLTKHLSKVTEGGEGVSIKVSSRALSLIFTSFISLPRAFVGFSLSILLTVLRGLGAPRPPIDAKLAKV